jgi:hypothetical protein
MKIGLIREGKVPVDKRVVLLPEQCQAAQQLFSGLSVQVQSSVIRCIKDEQYELAGFQVVENMRDCDLLLGVKEVPVKDLIPEKTYMFFSHTIKKQAYNRGLLQAILRKKIRLIDYECLTDAQGERIIAFGRYAGIVGAYNAFWTYGKRYHCYDMHRAIDCVDYEDLIRELKRALPHLPPIKIVLTGRGRAGKGSAELLRDVGIREVQKEAYLTESFSEPVYVHLASHDYYRPKRSDLPLDAKAFHQQPEAFEAAFWPYAQVSDIFISNHFWNPKAAPLFTKEQVRHPDFKIKIIADITCDINGSIPTTIRASTITDPLYDYNPLSEQEELAFSHERNITVMAIDNLPCELPVGASRSFGEQFLKEVLPHFFNQDAEGVLARATIAEGGKLTERYAYLEDYVRG